MTTPDVKEHPQLFKAEMVRAIREARKWMTRRAVTQNNSLIDGTGEGIRAHWPHLEWDKAWVDPGPSPAGNPGPYWKVPCNRPGYCEDVVHRIYPRVFAGDALWVKEAWGAVWPGLEPVPLEQRDIEYRADLPPDCTDRPGGWSCDADERTCWRPSIFMPRWATRLVLPVVRVGAERLQDISEEDAIAEGLSHDGLSYFVPGNPKTGAQTARAAFRQLWDSINGKRDGLAWKHNGPLWIYEWEKHEGDRP